MERQAELIRCAYFSDQSFHFLHHKIYQTRATTTTCPASVLATPCPLFPALFPINKGAALSFALSLRFLWQSSLDRNNLSHAHVLACKITHCPGAYRGGVVYGLSLFVPQIVLYIEIISNICARNEISQINTLVCLPCVWAKPKIIEIFFVLLKGCGTQKKKVFDHIKNTNTKHTCLVSFFPTPLTQLGQLRRRDWTGRGESPFGCKCFKPF